jgi:hypothetical protein
LNCKFALASGPHAGRRLCCESLSNFALQRLGRKSKGRQPFGELLPRVNLYELLDEADVCLLRTGRARPRRLAETIDKTAEFIRLEQRVAGGQFYWIACDGSEIRAGRGLVDAEPLQAGFVERMAVAGKEIEIRARHRLYLSRILGRAATFDPRRSIRRGSAN